MRMLKGKLNRRGGGVEEGAVGRWQFLYIAVCVGRYHIDRKDTRFLSIAKLREEKGIMS